MERIIFKYRGLIESPCKGGYKWKNGYSPDGVNGGIVYPWQGKKECFKQAKIEGKKAIFIDNL